jgi:uncharacterized membrane protein
MRRLGGGSMIMAAVFLIVIGLIVQSDITKALVGVLGWLMVVVGVVVAVIGIFQAFTGGGRKRGSDFDDF